MCTDYRRTRTYAQYVEIFRHTAFPLIFPEAHQAPNLMPQDEIRPTDPAPVFRRREHGLEMVTMRWGLVPWFHKGPLKGWRAMTVNARAESVTSAPAFRRAFARRRCLVPADGWVEWKGAGKPKPKFYVSRRDGTPIMFAGLWDRCRTEDQGVVESFTIVTQPAGSPLNDLHDRAPVVLTGAAWERWLDPSADVADLLGPESAGGFIVAPFTPWTGDGA